MVKVSTRWKQRRKLIVVGSVRITEENVWDND